MKILITAVAISMFSVASAATYTVNNNSSGFESNGVTDNAGNLISDTGGSAAFGFFSSDAAVTSAVSAADLLDGDWRQFGSSETKFITPSAPLNFEGLFESQGAEVTNLGDFAGKNVYLVLGNNSGLAASNEFIVYKFSDVYETDPLSEPINVELTFDVDTISLPNLLVGSIGVEQTVSPFDSTAQPTFRMEMLTPIPEPSSAALLGLGGLALLMRRRRESNL